MNDTETGGRPEDITARQLVEQMEALLSEHPSAQLYVKWTCPGCGERVSADDPNSFHLGGYVHEECGTLYQGDAFGFMAVFGPGAP